MAEVDVKHEGTIAVVTLANAPVNALSLAVRRRLASLVSALAVDTSVGGLVLTGNSNVFSAGADISEFGSAYDGAHCAHPSHGAYNELIDGYFHLTISAGY